MKRFRTLCAVVALSAFAASCGLKGGLERPAPLWGEKAKADYEAQKKAETAAKAAKKRRASVSIPVAGAAPQTNASASPSAGAPVEQITPAEPQSESSDDTFDSNPYDGKGAPPPVEDPTNPTSTY